MSRSYKRSPVCNCVKTDGTFKKIYNRKVRRKLDVPSGNWYRKMNESYNIADCNSWCSYPEWKSTELGCGTYVDESTCRDWWERHYRRK